VGGTALFAALLSLARVPEFSSTLSFFRAAVRKQPGAAVNWAMYCYILVTDCATTEARRAGEAAARALACDDLNRVFPEEYAMVVIIAALDLYHQQRFAEYEALVERGIASLPDDARCYSIVVRAQLALSTGKPEAARAILDVVFTSDHQRTSDLLRLRCRQGEILPNELAPMYQVAQVATAGPDANVRLGIEGSHQRLLLMLATAFQKCGDLERAFDVAAVLVNGHPGFAPGRKRLASLYRGLGLPAAADRLESIVTP
jgi:tetratricopeptide (TPR) repeat protein